MFWLFVKCDGDYCVWNRICMKTTYSNSCCSVFIISLTNVYDYYSITIRIQNLRSQFVLQQQHKLWSQILQFSLQSSTVSMILWLFIFMLWDNHISVFIKLSCDLKLFHVIVTCRNRVLCPWYTVIVYFRLCINLKTNLYISIVLWAVLSCIQRKLIHML